MEFRRLQMGDEIFSLEKNNNIPKKTEHPPPTGSPRAKFQFFNSYLVTQPESGPIRTSQPLGHSSLSNSSSSAFRPIQTSTSECQGQKTIQNLANFNMMNEKRLMAERGLPSSPSKRVRRFSDSEVCA